MSKIRELFLISYLPSADIISEILDRKLKNIKSYAFIYHDKDIYLKDILDDKNEIKHKKGDLKTPHYHIYLRLKSSREPDEIKRWFMPKGLLDDNCLPFNCLSQKVKSSVACIDYLIHKNDPEKYQYSENDIISYNIDSVLESDAIDNSIDIVEDMLFGFSTRELVKRYGKDFIYHYSSYSAIVARIKYEDAISPDNPLGDLTYINKIDWGLLWNLLR